MRLVCITISPPPYKDTPPQRPQWHFHQRPSPYHARIHMHWHSKIIAPPQKRPPFIICNIFILFYFLLFVKDEAFGYFEGKQNLTLLLQIIDGILNLFCKVSEVCLSMDQLDLSWASQIVDVLTEFRTLHKTLFVRIFKLVIDQVCLYLTECFFLNAKDRTVTLLKYSFVILFNLIF